MEDLLNNRLLKHHPKGPGGHPKGLAQLVWGQRVCLWGVGRRWGAVPAGEAGGGSGGQIGVPGKSCLGISLYSEGHARGLGRSEDLPDPSYPVSAGPLPLRRRQTTDPV